MHPILRRWRRFELRSYTAFLYLGLLCGTFAANAAARHTGLDPARVVFCTLVLLMPALIGARLLFVVEHWPIYRQAPQRVWHRSEGGASLYGGLLLAVPLSWPVLRALGLPVGAFWDVSVFTMLVGLFFTRIGCTLNGCCGGRVTTSRYSMHLADVRGRWARRVPVQLWEMAVATGLFVGAVMLWKHEPFAGALFLQVIAAYGLARLLLDSWRERETSNTARASRVYATLCVVVPLTILAAAWRAI